MVTLVYFHAGWCGPCRQCTRALEKMPATDADIALRKIDFTDAGPAETEEYKITALPNVKVYNRGGGLVGTVTAPTSRRSKVTSTQAKSGG